MKRITDSFSRYSILVEFYFTEYSGHAMELTMIGIRNGFTVIVACGGDGTVNEVVNGIMRSKKDVAMGVIPLGRGNDFAWGAGIPNDIDRAVSLIAEGNAGRCDVGFLKGGAYPEGRYFDNGAGIGFEALINRKASSFRHVNGMPSYILALLANIVHLPRPYDLSLEVDGKRRDVTCQQLSISNGRRMGSAFILGPEAVLNDGLLDLSYANRKVHHLELLKLVIAFLRGKQLELDLMEHVKCRSVTIVERGSGMEVQADGEEMGHNAKKISVEIISSALSLFYSP